MINKELPVGAEFKYRNQKYIVTQTTQVFSCHECKEANAQYIKRNRSKCIATSERSGCRRDKFDCFKVCGAHCYPKRIE